MRWTAPATGIAMCNIQVAVAELPESAYGYKCPFSGEETWSVVAPTPGVEAEPAISGLNRPEY